MPLESNEGAPGVWNAAQLRRRIPDYLTIEFQELRQLDLVKFADALFDILRQTKSRFWRTCLRRTPAKRDLILRATHDRVTLGCIIHGLGKDGPWAIF
jgi:hypothetical protein